MLGIWKPALTLCPQMSGPPTRHPGLCFLKRWFSSANGSFSLHSTTCSGQSLPHPLNLCWGFWATGLGREFTILFDSGFHWGIRGPKGLFPQPPGHLILPPLELWKHSLKLRKRLLPLASPVEPEAYNLTFTPTVLKKTLLYVNINNTSLKNNYRFRNNNQKPSEKLSIMFHFWKSF